MSFSSAETVMDLKGRILMYCINGCVHCVQAKRCLEKLQLPYVEVNVDTYPQCKEWMFANVGKKTVPQIFFNDVHVGGYTDLKELVSDDKRLRELIEYVRDNPITDKAPCVPGSETDFDGTISNGLNCEKDEYVELVQDLKASGIITSHLHGFCGIKKSFSGRQFVDWVTKTKNIDRHEGLRLGKELINHHFGRQVKNGGGFVDDNVYYMLLEDNPSSALNANPISNCKRSTIGKLGEYIRRQILAIYDSYLSSDGKSVNYKGIADSKEYQKYEKLTLELQRVQFGKESDDEKLAFFINIYNALVIHGIIRFGPPTNVWKRYNFFNKTCYIIGGYSYSLQDIENGVLRANEKGIGMITKPFPKTDPRIQMTMQQVNPFIHFALVCGASGCPPIGAYSAQEIHSQLQLAAEVFLEDDANFAVDVERNQVKLSQIFKWYKKDFGNSDKELLEWISNVIRTGDKKSNLTKIMDSEKVVIVFLPYNWNLNS